jgi:hypothetical protein
VELLSQLCNSDLNSIDNQGGDSEWPAVFQTCQQALSHCLIQYELLKTELEQNVDKYVSISQWQVFQAFVETGFLDYALLLIDRDPQLRSLLPEVVRLLKLLQLDAQFWQAARQPERRSQRRQQFLDHLIQLGQLLTAIDQILGEKSR